MKYQLFFDNKLVPISIIQFERLKEGYQKLYGIFYIIQQGDIITLLPTKDIRKGQSSEIFDPEMAMNEIERLSRQVGKYEQEIRDKV